MILFPIQEDTAVNLAVKPKQMKPLIAAAGILGLVLRAVLYRAGVDHKGLLISGYWADTAVWCLTAAVALVLLLWCRQLTGSKNHHKAFPASVFAAAGSVAAGIAFGISPVGNTPSQSFALLELVLRLAAAGSLIWVGYCRFRGKAPLFLFHGIVCMYLALRLVCQYRVWSADPQIQNYAFYLGAHVALMFTAYQLAAFDTGAGDHRRLWAAGLAGIYLSTVSVLPSEEPLFLVCCALWVWTNLSRPSSRKRVKPTKKLTVQEDTP